MKKHLLLASFLLFLMLITTHAQTNKYSADLDFVKPFGDNFIGEHYDDLALGFGFKYYFVELSGFDLGLSENIGLLNGMNFYNFNTRVALQTSIWKLSPYFGVGYSILYFHPEEVQGMMVDDEIFDGPNMNIGLKFHFSPKLYFNTCYDFVRLRVKPPAVDLPYNRNIQLFTFGMGVQLNNF